MPKRICERCNTSRILSSFILSKDGEYGNCKFCRAHDIKEKEREARGKRTCKTCKTCNIEKPIKSFYSAKYVNCKSCHVKYVKKNIKANPKRHYEATVKYRKKDPEKWKKYHRERSKFYRDAYHDVYLCSCIRHRKNFNTKITAHNKEEYRDLLTLEKDKLIIERKIKHNINSL